MERAKGRRVVANRELWVEGKRWGWDEETESWRKFDEEGNKRE